MNDGRNSRRIQPESVVGHQTSFDVAMRVRMAELVENNHGEGKASVKMMQMSAEMASLPGVSISRHWTNLLCANPFEGGMYDVFLSFRDPAYNTPEKRSDYLSFKRASGSIALHIFIVAVLTIYAGTAFWFPDKAVEYTSNPTALVSIIVGMYTGLMSISIITLRLSHFSFTYDIRMLQRFHPATQRFYQSRYSQCFDDGLVVSGALATGLYMISQTLASSCPPGTTMLHLRSCSFHGSIAPEGVLLVTVVLWLQMLARGVSRLGLVCAWVIMIAAINICLWLEGSVSYLWVNLEMACILALSYELERSPLRNFVKSVRMLEAAEVNAQLKVALSKYQVRESEQALEAKRSMVRHIGHEIRTPLNIIGVGTDVLLKELKQLVPEVPHSILQVVEGIEDASTAALEVVNELLMFEKLAAGMTSIEAVPIRIVRFIDKAMDQHAIPALAKKINFDLSVDLRDSDLGVNIDPVKMTVVFRNIFR